MHPGNDPFEPYNDTAIALNDRKLSFTAIVCDPTALPNVEDGGAYDSGWVCAKTSPPFDVNLPGMLHGKLLRSPYAHAKIINIDTSAAEQLPGVKAVLTSRDVPQKLFSPVYFTPTGAKSLVRDMLILSNRVRYVGQPVAVVVDH